MNLDFYRESVTNHGVAATLYHAAYRAANHVTRVAVWNALVFTPDRIDNRYLEDPRRTLGRWVEATAMRPYVSNGENGMTDEFLVEATQKHDRCFAFFEHGELMSYGWYTRVPTRLFEVSRALTLSFDPAYVYLYNAFTLPRWRGRRLHALGMAAALESVVETGHRGVVSYTDSSNAASLKSCRRAGCLTVGRLAIVKVGQRYVCRASPGCEAYGLRVEGGMAGSS